MRSRAVRVAALAFAAAAAVALPGGGADGLGVQRRYRLVRASDDKSKQSPPAAFLVQDTSCTPDLGGLPAPQGAPQVLGDLFDPAKFDEISVARNGRLLAYATSVGESGIPGATRQVVLLPEGPGLTSVRIPKVGGGDNDQPSVQFDDFGYRCVFRSTGGAGGAKPWNVQLHSLTRAPEADESATVAVTTFAAGSGDAAWDPTFTARVRTRIADGGVKVRERDARVAFASTGDLTAEDAENPGANPGHREQLFLWEEQRARFRQLTRHEQDGAKVGRPSMDKSGFTIAFESTADLTPDAADPLDPARVGNPGGVRQIYLWRDGRGVRQVTWSDRDCFAPRLDATGRFLLFCSRGDPLTGGNPEGNYEVFAWVSTARPLARLRQMTRTAKGDSVLPRPGSCPDVFAFYSTAHPPKARSDEEERPEFGEGEPQCTPSALVHDRGRVVHVHGYLDGENAVRLAAQENPVLTGPPALGTDALKVFLATNDYRLNRPPPDSADDDEEEPNDATSLLAWYVAMATRYAR